MPKSSSHARFFRLLKVFVLTIISIWFPIAGAQDLERLKVDISEWLDQSAFDLSQTDLLGSIEDLEPLREMVGEARIVAVSESNHAAKEPMLFRNRVFRFLVEELDFEAIVLESGVVESQVLNDYVINGEGDPNTLFELGISNGFHSFKQNRELINWTRSYNAGRSADSQELQIFGMDVSGSPYDSSAARNPDTAIRTALEYLQVVDPSSADNFTDRFDRFLPVLADIFDYGTLTTEERNSITSSISELVSLFQRRRFEYIELSNETEYEWGAHAAVAALQVDAWFRQIPLNWESSDGFEWNIESQEMRDRIMFDNLNWILDQVGPDGRVLVFASVGHIAATQKYLAEDEIRNIDTPFGMYARDKYGEDFVNILNLSVSGEIEICPLPASQRRRSIAPPPAGSVEAMFSVQDKPQYLIDLRSAPAPVYNWLIEEQKHWNGFGSLVFPIIPAFDVVYYVSPITPDCVP